MSTPQTTQVAETPHRPLAWASWLSRVGAAPILGPLAGLVLLSTCFSILSPVFLTAPNLSQVFQQVMEVGTLAVGQTIIMIAAGIDLSNGGIMVLGSVVIAKMAVQGTPVPLAILAGLALTIALGLINGFIVARVRLPPFIVTLGMLNIVYASTLLFTAEAAVQNLPPGVLFLGAVIPLGNARIPVGPLVMIAVIAVVWYALRQTAWGRHTYAVGDNLEAARVTGINIYKQLVSIYAAAGFIYGVAALLVLGRTTVGDPQAGQTDNLDSITAVVIGGTSLFGGRGSVIGTLIGALIVGIIRNGLTLIGVDALWQTFATGAIVIAAAAVDQATRRRR